VNIITKNKTKRKPNLTQLYEVAYSGESLSLGFVFGVLEVLIKTDYPSHCDSSVRCIIYKLLMK